MGPKSISNYKSAGLFLSLLLVAVPLLSSNFTLDPKQSLHFTLVTLLIAIYLLGHKQMPAWSKQSYFFFTAYGAFVLYSVVSVVISPNPSDAFFVFGKYILFGSLAFTVSGLQRPTQLFRGISRWLLLLTSPLLVVAYFQLVRGSLAHPELSLRQASYYAVSVFVNRNLFAHVLLLLVPFNAYAHFAENKLWKWLGMINYGLAILLLIALNNRAAWLALGVCGVVVGGLWLIKHKRQAFGKKIRAFVGYTLVLLLVGVVGARLFDSSESVLDHAASTLVHQDIATQNRIGLWTATLRLIRESPMLGSGLESWKINILKHGVDQLPGLNAGTFHQRPHNDFLWVAAEQGIIGLLLYGLILGAALLFALHLFFSTKDDTARAGLLVTCFVLLGYGTISMVSFPKERIIINLILYSTLGYLFALCNHEQPSFKAWMQKPLHRTIAAVFFIMLIVMGLQRMRGEYYTKRAIAAKANDRYDLVVQEIEQARSVFYLMDPTSTPLAWYQALAQYNLGRYAQALGFFEQAYALNPNHKYLLNDYGSCLLKTGHTQEAVSFFEKAIALPGNFETAQLNLCALYHKNSQQDKAFEVLKGMDLESEDPRCDKTISVIMGTLIHAFLNDHPDGKYHNCLSEKNTNNLGFLKLLIRYAHKNNLNMDQTLQDFCK